MAGISSFTSGINGEKINRLHRFATKIKSLDNPLRLTIFDCIFSMPDERFGITDLFKALDPGISLGVFTKHIHSLVNSGLLFLERDKHSAAKILLPTVEGRKIYDFFLRNFS